MPATLHSRAAPRRARTASTAIQAAMISSPYISRDSSMPTVRISKAPNISRKGTRPTTRGAIVAAG